MSDPDPGDAGTGTLVLVATPIGNLGDLPPRAVQALADAGVIVCEDTRRTGRLLAHAGVARTRMIVADEHHEASAAAEVRSLLDAGATVAVVTDAGTPGISDPGERLVRVAIDGGHRVTAVPGPAAAVMAVALSGLPAQRFVMEGFLPRRGRERAERLAALTAEARTIVLYEAPHRLARTLADLADAVGGDRPVVIARELTKLHEELWRGTVTEGLERIRSVTPRGEHVLVLAGAPATEVATDEHIEAALQARYATGEGRKDAIARVAADLHVGRRRVYELAHRSSPPPLAPPGAPAGAPLA